MNKKTAIICCALGASGMIYGTMNFDLGGISSTALAIAVSMSITLGAVMFLYGAYNVFKGKPKIITANKGEKPMAKKKQNLMKDEQDAVLSVDLMKREKELETRRKELESLLAEVTKEEKAVEKRLLEKGWVQKDGVWGIE
jgi:hypothetical protein|tara:strand:+ start:73 stop:495 length:423 start_codon:yes stop_codon:yes gene_type:complete